MPRISIKKGSKTFREMSFFDEIDIISIGRGSANDISLPDPKPERPKISRYHAAIIKSVDDHYFLRDLGSRNQTRLNNRTVYRYGLSDGDVIEVGDYKLYFYEKPTTGPDRDIVPVRSERDIQRSEGIENYEGTTSTTVYYTLHEIPEELSEIVPDKKEVVLDIAKRLKVISDIERMCRELICSIPEILIFEKGYIALFRDGVLKPVVKYGIDDKRGEKPPDLSEEIWKQVFDEGSAVLSENYCKSGKSVMCLPLKGVKGNMGILWFERRQKKFSKEDLEVLSFLLDRASLILSSSYNNEADTGERTSFLTKGFEWKARIIGNYRTPSMNKIYKDIENISKGESNVFLLGESGTGKEVMANTIHEKSGRKGKFIAFNAAGVTETLAESTLFGVFKEAHSTAKRDTKGFFEEADKGTLFIDEIGDMPIFLQPKILRATDPNIREIQKLGNANPIRVNVRVIGGTNKDIDDAMERGSFRKDLYYRLGIKITLPPLRERNEDIPLLATYFLDKYCKMNSKEIKGITHEAMNILMKYKWPGNIRELEENIKCAVDKTADQDFLYLTDFLFSNEESIKTGEKIYDRVIKGESKKRLKSLNEIVHEAVKETLDNTGWNVRKAAKILGKAPQTMYKIIKEAGIERPEKE